MAKKNSASARSVVGSLDKDWQAQMDCDTLMRAAEIRKDPKRFKAAQAVAKERIEELSDLDGDAATESSETKPDGDE